MDTSLHVQFCFLEVGISSVLTSYQYQVTKNHLQCLPSIEVTNMFGVMSVLSKTKLKSRVHTAVVYFLQWVYSAKMSNHLYLIL